MTAIPPDPSSEQPTVHGEDPSNERWRDKVYEVANRLSHDLAGLQDVALEDFRVLFGPVLRIKAEDREGRVRATPELLPIEAWRTIATLPVADHLRLRFGETWTREQADPWVGQLYRAIDDAIDAFWLLRAGNAIGAAIIARTLLERWTLNVAHNYSITRSAGEGEAAFMSRTWSVYSSIGAPANAGDWWGWLSELLHGRAGDDTFGEPASQGLDGKPQNNITLHVAIARAIDLSLHQIKGGLAVVASHAGLLNWASALQSTAQLEGWRESEVIADAFRDLDFFECLTKRSQGWVDVASIYRELVVDDGRELDTKVDGVLTIEAMLERRGRAVQNARDAFDSERESTGPEFDPTILGTKMFRFACIAEMGQLVAMEAINEAERLALETAAQAQRAATHLWLEDSDYAIGCIRVLLEQTARLRTYRLKPVRAKRMENTGRASAARWLEAAGWRRLSTLGRATDEFSHLTRRSRRRGARELLRLMQGTDAPLETSRGALLNEVTYMFAFELHARLLLTDATVAEAFTSSITLVDESDHAAELERYLQVGLANRNMDFGPPDAPQ